METALSLGLGCAIWAAANTAVTAAQEAAHTAGKRQRQAWITAILYAAAAFLFLIAIVAIKFS